LNNQGAHGYITSTLIMSKTTVSHKTSVRTLITTTESLPKNITHQFIGDISHNVGLVQWVKFKLLIMYKVSLQLQYCKWGCHQMLYDEQSFIFLATFHTLKVSKCYFKNKNSKYVKKYQNTSNKY